MDYPSNSHKSRLELENQSKKTFDKVIKGAAREKQRSNTSRIAGEFLAKNLEESKNNFVRDILVPGIQNMILNGLSMLMTGNPIQTTNNKSSNGNVSYVSYSNKNRASSQQPNRATNYSSAYSFAYNDITFDSRGEAEMVLSQMRDALLESEVISVGDLYDLAGLKHNYTYYNYGWDDLSKATVVHLYDGYLLKMPAPFPINQ